jgi:suppressor for copper-sensitivity B
MMKKPVSRSYCFWILTALLTGLLTGPLMAQEKDKFPSFSGLQGLGSQSEGESKIKVSSRFLLDETQTRGALQVVVDVPKGWHIYSVTQPPGGPTRTEVMTRSNPAVRFTGPFQPNEAPHKKKSEFFPVNEEYHEGQVIWTAPFELAAGSKPQQLVIEGEIKGQICGENGCILLNSSDTAYTAKFDPTVVLSASPPTNDGSSAPTGIAPTGIVMEPFSWSVLLRNVGLGILGGLILNLMPCVLPVIGLKLLSFVEQSHGNRWQAIRLNLIYTLGILSVFFVLATLSAFLNMGWGEHFTSNTFKISMVILVFAMALSFLGIWEIPIPGFVGRGTSEQLAAKEGVAGAFFKGVFTTILATPCSGPFLGPLFGYTIKQPPIITYVIMLSVGLGLALPYLLIGAFPALLRWIPKPGAWMDTFKQLMGFVLLGATVFLISTISDSLFIATLTFMIGVWFGCWWIGRVPITAALDRKLVGWVGGIAASASIGFLAFNYLGPKQSHLDWTTYSPGALVAASQDGKTVLVDFTADWCLTCKMNMARAIDTQRVADLVRQLGVVPMLADWSDKSDEIKSSLEALGSRSIPLLAIYPANNSGNPIILRDVLSEKTVLSAIEQAGPSAGVEVQTVSQPTGGNFSQTRHSTALQSRSL